VLLSPILMPMDGGGALKGEDESSPTPACALALPRTALLGGDMGMGKCMCGAGEHGTPTPPLTTEGEALGRGGERVRG
jgi:hypothetical protein